MTITITLKVDTKAHRATRKALGDTAKAGHKPSLMPTSARKSLLLSRVSTASDVYIERQKEERRRESDKFRAEFYGLALEQYQIANTYPYSLFAELPATWWDKLGMVVTI